MKRAINILVFPYRDQYFLSRYGSVVRDLQIIEALSHNPQVNQVCVVNRPVSVPERILGKRRPRPDSPSSSSRCRFWDTTSPDLLGPLSGRSWTRNCYGRYLTAIRRWTRFSENAINILLDFTPLARIDYARFPGYVVWYDVIDNFTKHNRYSKRERLLVEQKYRQVSENAPLITGVTAEALSSIRMNGTMVVPNGLNKPVVASIEEGRTAFDIGFIGFVTNKFDLDVIRILSAAGFRIAVYGEVYDRKIKKALAGRPGVTIMGKFHGNQLPEIMKNFTIGIIPYRKDRTHDGSPIKLYQFMAYGKPVITTQEYPGETNGKEDFVLVTEGLAESEIVGRTRALLDRLRRERILFAEKIRKSIGEEIFWPAKVRNILEKLGEPEK